MKNIDKITLTIGQLKRLIKEAKSSFNDPYYDVEFITYNHVLDALKDEDIEDVIVNYGEDLADYLQDFYTFASNQYNLQKAILKMAKLIARGNTIQSLRKLFGNKAI